MKIILVIFSFIMLSLETPFAAESQAPAIQEQKNKTVDYTIEIPSNWEIVKQYQGVDLVALAPKRESQYLFRTNMNIISANLGFEITRDEFYQYNLESLNNLLSDFNLENAKDVTIGGVSAKKLTFTHTMGIVNVRVNQYLILRNAEAYVMTFTAAREDFDNLAPLFDKIADSFKFQTHT